MGRPVTVKNHMCVTFRLDGVAYNDIVKISELRKTSLGAQVRAYVEAGLYADQELLNVQSVS